MGCAVWKAGILAVLVLAAFAPACADDSNNNDALRTRVADLETSTSRLQTVEARPTAAPPTAAPTATPITALVVQNTAASDTGCPPPLTQAVDWVAAGQRFSACFDPSGACVRLARIGGPLPAECGGVFAGQ